MDDDAANQDIRGIGNRFTVFLQVFKAELYRFANVRERFFHCLALRIASRKRRTDYNVAAVLIRFQQHLEI